MQTNRFIIKNFLTDEECKHLISDANKENNWFDKGGNSNVLLHKINRHDISQKIYKKLMNYLIINIMYN